MLSWYSPFVISEGSMNVTHRMVLSAQVACSMTVCQTSGVNEPTANSQSGVVVTQQYNNQSSSEFDQD